MQQKRTIEHCGKHGKTPGGDTPGWAEKLSDISNVDTQAVRIMSSLISAKAKARGMSEDGESYVGYMSDKLGIVKTDIVRVIGLLRNEGILRDAKDLVFAVFVLLLPHNEYADALLDSSQADVL